MSLGFILGVDIIISATVWYLLPDTQSLVEGVQLVRTGADSKTFNFVVGPKNKKYVPLNQIPQILQTSILELEDDRFYQHRGFDIEEIFNAVSSHLEKGRRLRGASTLSQQLVKNLYLTHERTFRRKIFEALITIKLEATLPKRKIIEIYINSIDWGRGLLGISDASHYYFKKRPRDLSLKESIFLAAIIPNPKRFSKLDEDQTPKLFVRRQMMKALEALYQAGLISVAEYQQALAEPININP